MIVCKNCGHQNEDNDTFCGSCGKFLEWTGERVAIAQPEPEPEPPPPAVEPEPARLSLIERVRQAVFVEEPPPQTATTVEPPPQAPTAPAPQPSPELRVVPLTSAAPPPSASPAAPAAAPPAPAVASPRPNPPVAAPAGSTWPPATTAPVTKPEQVLAGVGAPAAPPPAPTTPTYAAEPVSRHPDEPLSRQPTAPTLTRPRAAPRPVEAPTRRRPGDLVCGQCGEGNDPIRHFCRRCGNSLDEAVIVRLPWYRRLWNWMFHRTYAAGYRHRRIGPPNVLGLFWRIVRLAVAVIILVALLAFVFVPPFHNLVVDRATTAFTSIRKIVHPNYDPVYPVGTSASSAIAGHLPPLVDDRLKGTYWAALPTDRTPTLTFRFDSPQDLADIGFTSGASGTAPSDQFLAQPRPHAVHLVFSDGTSKDLSLADTDKAQFFPIDAKQVTSVIVQVESVWPTAAPPPSSVAIDEVEFRIKD